MEKVPSAVGARVLGFHPLEGDHHLSLFSSKALRRALRFPAFFGVFPIVVNNKTLRKLKGNSIDPKRVRQENTEV